MTSHGVQCLVPETLPWGEILPQTKEAINWSIRQLLHIGQQSLQTKAFPSRSKKREEYIHIQNIITMESTMRLTHPQHL